MNMQGAQPRVWYEHSAQGAPAEALLDSRVVQDLLLEAVPTPIFFKDIYRRFLRCNSAFATLLGRPREDIIGKIAHDIAPTRLASVALMVRCWRSLV